MRSESAKFICTAPSSIRQSRGVRLSFVNASRHWAVTDRDGPPSKHAEQKGRLHAEQKGRLHSKQGHWMALEEVHAWQPKV